MWQAGEASEASEAGEAAAERTLPALYASNCPSTCSKCSCKSQKQLHSHAFYSIFNPRQPIHFLPRSRTAGIRLSKLINRPLRERADENVSECIEMHWTISKAAVCQFCVAYNSSNDVASVVLLHNKNGQNCQSGGNIHRIHRSCRDLPPSPSFCLPLYSPNSFWYHCKISFPQRPDR